MTLPKRKNPRLKGYNYTSCGAYYVTICTKGRTPLLKAALHERSDDPVHMIKNWLLEMESKYDHVIIDQYSIMPDHIHFLLFINKKSAGPHTERSLQEMISWFKTMTTNEYIKGVKEGRYPPFDQHIWQRSYYEHIVRNEEDLNEIRKYIDENKLKWEQNHKGGEKIGDMP